MKRRMRGGHRLALVWIASVMASLGSAPALADDGPIVTVASAVDGATAATSSADLVDPAGTLVDTVSSTASTTVDTVSGAASGASGAISGATSDAGQSVSGSAETLMGSAQNAVGALGSAVADSGAGTVSGTTEAPQRTGGSSANTVTSSDSGTRPLSPHGEPSLSPTLREEARVEGTLAGAHDEDPCPAPTNPLCSSAAAASEGDSLAEKVAAIIGLLAVTGLRLIPWAATALILTIAGSIALNRGRPRRSETGHAIVA